jgi:tetratricopeptide (TPR) repeat protein
VTLYELLTGRRPFDAGTTPDLVYQVLSNPTPHVAGANDTVPLPLDALVAKAMARDPGERYQSAAQLAEGLAQLAAISSRGISRSSSSLRSAAPAPAPTLPRWRKVAYTGGALAVALSLFASGYLLWGNKTAAPTTPFQYVAVLPFAANAGDGDTVAAAAAISEVFTSALEGLSSVTLVSKSDVDEYLRTSGDARRSARNLGAVTVSGMVSRAGKALRFSVKVERRDGSVLAAHAYQGDAAAMAGLESQAVDDVVSALNVRLTNADRQRLQRVPACRSEAIADYASARALLDREDVPGNAAKAEFGFGQAIAKDPGCAQAHAGLADADWALYRATKDPSWAARADQAIQRASALDSESRAIRKSEAVFYQNTGRSDAAERTLRAVIAQWPNDDEAHRLLSSVLDDQDRSIEAAAELQQAIALRPTNWINYLVQGNTRFDGQHFAEAVESYRRVLSIQPDNVWAITNLGAAYWRLGEREKAIAVYQSAPVRDDAILGNMALFYFDMGQYGKAAEAWQQALTLAPNDDVKHGNLGDAYSRLGRKSEALEQYRLAADRSSDRLMVNPANAMVLARHAVYDAKLGRSEAVQHAIEAVRLSPDDPTVLYKRAVVHCLLNQPQEAVIWLRRAIAKQYPRESAKADADLDPIKKRPDVAALLREN